MPRLGCFGVVVAKASEAKGEEVRRTPRWPQHSGKVVVVLDSDIGGEVMVVVRERIRGWTELGGEGQRELGRCELMRV